MGLPLYEGCYWLKKIPQQYYPTIELVDMRTNFVMESVSCFLKIGGVALSAKSDDFGCCVDQGHQCGGAYPRTELATLEFVVA
ncbi:hypothetical protein TNCV_2155361 [Trichonephila clavipes]|nr:hypothetical protein TNCV_2155361 [Trichonephila clavipes]